MAAPAELTTAKAMDLDPKYDDYDFPTTAPGEKAGSGHPGHTTPEQDASVHMLRGQLEQEGFSERLDTLTLVSARPSALTLAVLYV
jgi:hypothetical protein